MRTSRCASACHIATRRRHQPRPHSHPFNEREYTCVFVAAIWRVGVSTERPIRSAVIRHRKPLSPFMDVANAAAFKESPPSASACATVNGNATALKQGAIANVTAKNKASWNVKSTKGTLKDYASVSWSRLDCRTMRRCRRHATM